MSREAELKDETTPAPRMTTRLEWELSERVAELERQLRGMVEVERTREAELLALKQELDLRMSHAALLEKVSAERQTQIEWSNQHITGLSAELEAQRSRARQFEDELNAERRRTSYQLVQMIVSRYPRSRGMRILKQVARVALSRR